eukprot:13168633-Ditylum_brightwellii.AAC.1
MGKCCLAIDNYFTLPIVTLVQRDMRIGFVGISHFRQGWPPKNSATSRNKMQTSMLFIGILINLAPYLEDGWIVVWSSE